MSVTIFSTCGGIQNSYTPVIVYSGSEPLAWDSYTVVSQDANGNPLITDFYLGSILQFVRTRTYNSQSKITSETIS